LGQSSHILHDFFVVADAGGAAAGEDDGSGEGTFVVEFGLLVDNDDAGLLVFMVEVGFFVANEDLAVVVV